MVNTSVRIVPKHPDGIVRATLLGRVSTQRQNQENIEASFKPLEDTIRTLCDGPVEFKYLGEQASGMLIDRASVREAEDDIESGVVDVVAVEDLSRAYRNTQYQIGFVQLAVDCNTRVIALGDGLDTTDPNWEVIMHVAAVRHGLYIPDTRRRVRRTATFSFHRGGMVIKYPPGYRKLSKEEANSGQFGPMGLRIAKLDDWTPIIQEMRQRVLRGDSYPAIAKWLNDEGIPPGKYCKKKRWTGKLVAALLRNGLLSGCRIFRDQMHEYIYSTGKHKRVKNPCPEREDYAELAHLTCEEHQELLEVMAARDPRNEHVDHQRKGVARSKTLFPGQHLKCPICCETMFWASRGHLRCRNAKPDSDHSCWNQTFVSVEHVRTMLLPKLLEILEQHPELRQRLIDTAWSEYERALVISRRHSDEDERRLAELQREAEQLAEAIAKRALDALLDRLEQTQTEIKALQTRLKQRRQEVEQSTKFMSKQDVENGLPDAVLELSRTSFEFGALMRQMFPDFYAYPAQALDTPQVHARVVLRLPTGSAESDSNGPENSKSITVDAFEPALHIANAQRCWTAKQEHPEWSLKRIGKELSLCYMTVKRALAYARLMIARNTTDPYIVLTERPAEASRWRAHSQCQEPSDSSGSTPPQTPNDRVDDSEASDSTGTSEAA